MKRKIRVIRERVNMLLAEKMKRQTDLAESTDIPIDTLKYCLREGLIMQDNLLKIAEYLDCDLNYLTGETDIVGTFYDYKSLQLWDENTDHFRLWVRNVENDIVVRPYDLPYLFKQTGTVYKLADYIRFLTDETSTLMEHIPDHDDGYDLLALDTMDFLRKKAADAYKMTLENYRNDLTINFFNTPTLNEDQKMELHGIVRDCLINYLNQNGLSVDGITSNVSQMYEDENILFGKKDGVKFYGKH